MRFKMVHENYNVSDLNRSLEFYEKALGLTEVRRKTAYALKITIWEFTSSRIPTDTGWR